MSSSRRPDCVRDRGAHPYDGAVKSAPIIFIAAYDDDPRFTLNDGYELGAVDYLVKLIKPGLLRSKVGVFLELFRRT